MVKSDFLQFSAKDFILNESFQLWAIHAQVAPATEWDEWLKLFPERTVVVNEAKLFVVDLIDRLEEVVTLEEAEESWSAIERRLIY